ncbi:T cell receptor beta chain MC.7.G5-like [Neosynchiropus ocellatus]
MLTVCLCLFIGVCLGVEVHQRPPELFVEAGQEAQLVCSHNRGDYTYMQWYQQSPGESALKRIGHLSYENKEYEEPFKDNFRFSGDLSGSSKKNASMFIKGIKAEHSACLSLEVRQTPEQIIAKPGDRVEMVCQHSRTDYRQMLWYKRSTEDNLMDLIGNLYVDDATMEEPLGRDFKISGDLSGNTAKKSFSVTVLQSEDQVSRSGDTVKIECSLGLGNKVSNYFMYWDGDNVTEGVSTDHRAQRDGDKYQITSRLRVRAKEWLREGRNYTCRVSYFDGTTTDYEDSVKGVKRPGQDDAITREEYLNVTHMAKLSYVVLIFKSCVYAVFVVFLLRRLQRAK